MEERVAKYILSYQQNKRLIAMINALPRKAQCVFGPTAKNLHNLLAIQRKSILRKTQDRRLAMIHFHTFRHWKTTMLYYKTKNPMLSKNP